MYALTLKQFRAKKFSTTWFYRSLISFERIYVHIELHSDRLSSGQLHENPSTHAIFIKPSHKPLTKSN